MPFGLSRNVFCLFLVFFVIGCGSSYSGRNTIFIIDTSGSMKADGLLKQVKASVHKILKESEPGDRVFAYAFDSQPRAVVSATVTASTADIERIYAKLDALKPNGPWTDLQSALDESLQTTVELLRNDPDRKTVLVLYTDGHDDPPPGEKRGRKLDFNELFRKYYSDGKSKSWFIYYVELAKPEPELRAFLEKTRSGKVISKEDFLGELNVTKFRIYQRHIKLAVAGALVLLSLILLVAYRRYRAFRNAYLVAITAADGYANNKETTVETPEMIWIGTRPAVMFKYFVEVGSTGDVEINGKGIEGHHARIKASLFGRFFVKPVSDGILRVDGQIIRSEVEIRPGQKIQIGSREFLFHSKQ